MKMRKTIIFISIILFVLLLLLVIFNKTGFIDNSIYKLIISLKSDRLTSFMKVITFFASVKFMCVVNFIILLLSLLFKKRKGYFIIFIMLIEVILNYTLKNIIRRKRPVKIMLIEETSFSFPSGHTMGSIAFYGTIIYFITKCNLNIVLKRILIGILVCLITLIMISRIYLGVHYASDVIGGILISLVYLNIILLKVEEKYESISDRSK